MEVDGRKVRNRLFAAAACCYCCREIPSRDSCFKWRQIFVADETTKPNERGENKGQQHEKGERRNEKEESNLSIETNGEMKLQLLLVKGGRGASEVTATILMLFEAQMRT